MKILLVLLCVLAFTGCDNDPSIVYPQKAVLHWTAFDTWADSTVAKAAQADLIIFPLTHIFTDSGKKKIVAIKAINPDAKIVGYLLLMQDVVNRHHEWDKYFPFATEMHELLEPYWAYTTTGDTLMQWPDEPMLNPIVWDEDGQYFESDIVQCLNIVDLVKKYRNKGYILDGVMLDYFMYEPYPLRPRVTGEIDFDGDGVVWKDDIEERALFEKYQLIFAQALRYRFGDDFIIIGNGMPPQERADFAAKLNGIMFEDFPGSPWGWTQKDGFSRMMYCQRPGYLTRAQGRTWSFLVNWRPDYLPKCFYSSLLAGCFYADIVNVAKFTGWHIDAETGAALGPPSYTTAADSVWVERDFENGTARVLFVGNNMTRYGFGE